MRFTEVKKFLIKFTSDHEILFPNFSYEFGGPYHAKSEWEKKIPLADDNGIYLYATRNEVVFLIGKGEFAQGGGIGNRVCSHLGKAQPKSEIMFPNHEWKNDQGVPDSIRRLIESGDFNIHTMRIEPPHYCSLIEVISLSYCRIVGGSLPPLNKRIG